MIRVIGLDKNVYDSILNHNHNIVKDNDDNSKMIEFIPECALEYSNAVLTIECSDNIVNFMYCDFWRIEIE